MWCFSYKLRTFLLLCIFLSGAILSAQSTSADKSVCSSSTSISAIPEGGVWTTTGGASIVSPSSGNTVVNDLDPGTNTFTYTIGASSDDVVVTNNEVIATATNTNPDPCLRSADLNGSAIPSGGSGQWSLLDENPDVSIANTALSVTTADNLPFGTTIFVWSVEANGCSDSYQLSITKELPDNILGSDQSGCTNTFYIGASTPPSGGTGTWSNVSGAGVSFDNINNPGVAITANNGTSNIRWTINYNTCTSTKDFVVSNNLPVPDAGIDRPICNNEITLAAGTLSTGETGVWSVVDPQGEVFTNASVENPTVSNIKRGTTTFEWKVTNAYCSATDNMVVTNNNPEVDAGTDKQICTSSYTFSANNPTPYTGNWTCSDANITFDNANLYNATASGMQKDVYTFTWTIDNGTCTASDDVIITSDFVQITAGADQALCNSSFAITGTDPPSGATGSWARTFGDGIIANSNNYSTSVSNVSEISRFKWTILSGSCTFTDEVQLSNQLPSQASANPDKAVCDNETLITATPPVDQNEAGIWTKIDVASGAFITNPTLFQTQVTNLDNGANTFKWTIYNQNCSTSDLIVVTYNEITTSAGADQIVCSTSASLAASLSGGTGYWTSTNTSLVFTDSTDPTTTVSNLDFSENALTWTRNDLGCSASDNMVITSNLPRNVSAGTDKYVCQDETNLTANNPDYGSGVWTTSGGSFIENMNNPETNVTNLPLGQNIFTWTVTYNGCPSSDDITVSNNRVVVDAGTDTPICATSTTLSATATTTGQSGYWTLIGGNGVFADSNSNTSSVSGLVKGINTFRWTMYDSYCTNYDEVTITNDTPDDAVAGDDVIVCENTHLLTAQAVFSGTGTWSVTDGSGSFVSPNNNNTTVNSVAQGTNTYTWTVTKNLCSLSDDVVVTNNAVNSAIVTNDGSICNPSHSTTITATNPSSGTIGVWTKVSTGAGLIQSSNNYETVVSNLANGNNRFRWTVSNADCSSFDEVLIVNDYYTATASAINSPTTCENYIAIRGSSAPSSGFGTWSSNNGNITFDNLNNTETYARNIPTGTSNLTWTVTNNGCSASTNFDVTNNSFAVSAGADIVGCDAVQNLNAQALSAGQTGLWDDPNNNITFDDNTSPTTVARNILNGAGGHDLTWTVTANGCTVSDVLHITNNDFSVTAGNDQVICGSSQNLQGSDPLTGTGTWSLVNGSGTFTNANYYATDVSGLQNGANTFRWTVTKNSCQASDEVIITNDLYLATASAPPSVCTNEVTVDAQALPTGSGASGYWATLQGGGVFDDINALSTTVRGLATGTNRFRWLVTKNTCQSYTDVEVINNEVETTAGIDKNICSSSIALQGSDPETGTGIWTLISGSGTFVNAFSYNTNVYGLQNGPNTFRWTVTRNSCQASDEVVITNDLYLAAASASPSVCTNEVIVNAQALPTGSGATGYWATLQGGGVFDDIDALSTTVRGLSAGTNRFRWRVVKNSCESYTDVVVLNNEVNISAGVDKAVCQPTSELYATTLASDETGLWTCDIPSVTISNPASSYSTVSNLQRGDNVFTWKVKKSGCEGSSTVTITNNDFDANAGIDQEVTESSTNMTAELLAGATGAWTIVAGRGTFSDAANATTAVNGLGYGKNYFKWMVEYNNCFSSDEVEITYNVAESNAGQDIATCNDNVTMLANYPAMGSGEWSVIQGTGTFADPYSYNTKVTNVSRGENIYRWTVTAFDIQAYDDVLVTNNSFDVSAGEDIQTCNTTVDLNAENIEGASGSWSILAGGGSFSDNNSNTSSVSAMFVGDNMYMWQVEKDNCTASDTVFITQYQPVTEADAGEDSFVCGDTEYTLNATQPIYGTGLWTTSNSDISISSPQLYTTGISNLPNGPSTFTWTITNEHCSSQDEVIISSWEAVELRKVPVSQEINEGEAVTFTVENTGNVEKYQWLKDGEELVDDGRISGANSATLTISPAVVDDMGAYKCVLNGYCNQEISSAAALSVISGFEDLSNNGIKIYPIPSDGYLNIDFEDVTKVSSLHIYNTTGRKVFEKSIVNRKEYLDLSKNGDGTYFILIKKDKKLIKGKFVIRK